jgi:ABC-type xylose transport system substrate-binding protein
MAAAAQAAVIAASERGVEEQVEMAVVVVVPEASRRRWMEIRLSTLRSTAAAGGSVETQAEAEDDSRAAQALRGRVWRRARAWDSQRVLRRMRAVESRASCE